MASVASAMRAPADRRRFFASSALLMAAIVVLSFPLTYYAPVLSGSRRFHLLHHVHAAAYFGWFLLYAVQTRLVASGGIARHRELGLAGFALTGAMIPLGYWMAQRAAELRIAAGAARPYESSWFNLADVGLFAALTIAAMLSVTRRPDWHRRLMYAAALCLLAAAASRWTLRIPYLDPLWLDVASYVLVYPFLVALGVHDVRTLGRLHPATLTGIVALVPLQLAGAWIARSAWWQGVGPWVLGAGAS